jgi:hypothetical protein
MPVVSWSEQKNAAPLLDQACPLLDQACPLREG